MKEIKQVHRRYMPGLDGIRALAVLAVIAYHLNWRWASGGFLGVSVFFVLSGYLITDMLLEERKNKHRIDLKTFWIRRIRRLLPAMLSMIVAVAVFLAITNITRLISIQGDIWSALTYTSNWYNIFHQVSYFESFGPPSPFGHLWSLAIEEQFYLLWPLLVIGLSRFFSPTRGKFVLLTLAGAILSFISMVILYEPGTDPSRVYYGTDTRAFGLLIGASLAFIWPSSKLADPNLRKNSSWLDMTGAVGLMVVIYMFIRTGEYDQSLYTGGMLVLSFASTFVIAAAASPSSFVSTILGWKPLRWIGVRSYSIYLWHYPVILLTNPANPNTDTSYFVQFIQLTLSIGLAALSYSLVENPFRSGNWHIWTKIPGFCLKGIAALFQFRFLMKLSPLVILVLICASYLFNRTSTEVTLHSQSLMNSAAVSSPAVQSPELTSAVLTSSTEVEKAPDSIDVVPTSPPKGKNSPVLTSPVPASSPEGKNSPVMTVPVPAASPNAQITPEQTPAVPSASNTDRISQSEKKTASENTSGTYKLVSLTQSVTAIGDSVMLGAAPVLEKMIAGIVVDGKVSRQLSQAPDMIKQFKTDKTLSGIVVIHLGTNGPFTSEQLDKLLEAIGEDRKIILINTRVPRKWQDTVNDALAAASKKHANVKLADWYSLSEDKSDWFVSDGVHLTTKGAEAYSKLILASVSSMRKTA
ncbi:acyltransferase family protein [Paenibacillus aceris]|uniref:Peptidoglycan/LPS O-acetylase OafA/YrhL n=1 Tax=Paenibacillus aceris TaxID=869555 RepID=A0ABS4I5W3_9BACL|nr:acyltransferase family protein [Paenibacillus aceris]MBP1966125.1 peptidoglycan/LPS O-acetylase OafA/YrhL [Paenibacillus aceris]NHW39651.1 acyltransferase family protein [Paenibacillus aceris]